MKEAEGEQMSEIYQEGKDRYTAEERADAWMAEAILRRAHSDMVTKKRAAMIADLMGDTPSDRLPMEAILSGVEAALVADPEIKVSADSLMELSRNMTVIDRLTPITSVWAFQDGKS